MRRPLDMPQWMRWVESQFSELRQSARSVTRVPVGTVVYWTGTAVADLPEGWVFANGNPFDAVEYPELAELLAGSTVPSIDAPAGLRAIILAG